MTTALQNEFEKVIKDTQRELLDPKNYTEWECRYHKYATDILKNMSVITSARKSFHEWDPLKIYLTTSNAKSISKTVRFELRFLGQTVAKLKSDGSRPQLDTKDYDVKNLRDFGCTVSLINEFWDDKGAKKFRKHFKTLAKPRSTNGNKANEEHRIESLLLTEFSKKSSTNKALTGIQPVKIGGIRFPMPTPIKASNHKKIEYSGPRGGGIDILTRVGTGGNDTRLCIMELKDENKQSEPPCETIKQAIAYATFIRELLRSKSGHLWWELFGFSGSVPQKLVLYAACVMPSNKYDDKTFANLTFDFANNNSDDKIILHTLYFTETVTKNRSIINQIDTSWKYEVSGSFFKKSINTHNVNCRNQNPINLKVFDVNDLISATKTKNTENNIQKILDKYGSKPFLEAIDLEALAYYQSYHDYGDKYGICFNLLRFAQYVLSTKKTLLSFGKKYEYDEVRKIVLNKVLQHERFHYLVELFITFEEISSGASVYKDYFIEYDRTRKTDNCYEEAMANYFAKMHFKYNGYGKYENDLNIMFNMQTYGYRLAAKINESCEKKWFTDLENQIFYNNSNCRSVLYKEVKEYYLKRRLGLSEFEIDGMLNIPLYIVDNKNMSSQDFEELLKLVFPRLV